MRATLVLIAAFVLGGAIATAQERRSQFSFTDFPATETASGRLAAPDFNSLPELRPFAGHVQAGLGRGVNLAGAFTIVSWPCRSQCVTLVVVDRRNGHLYTAPDAFNGMQFRADSRLLIVNPPETVPPDQRGNPPAEMRTEYWEFQDSAGFRRV